MTRPELSKRKVEQVLRSMDASRPDRSCSVSSPLNMETIQFSCNPRVILRVEHYLIRCCRVPAAVGGIRENLKADLAEGIAQNRLSIKDVELAADIVIGIWLQVTRGSLERRAEPDLTRQALDAVLRALGCNAVAQSQEMPGLIAG